MNWPNAARLHTDRLVLEPLVVEHAAEMVHVLAPEELYAFTGGEPPSDGELEARYVRQIVGHSPSGDAGWLNWIIRANDSSQAIGYIQATLTREDGVLSAELAWLVTPDAQHGGVASEAARAMLAWLRAQQVQRVTASIHPDHHASARVAQRLGLEPTGAYNDGEQTWEVEVPVVP